jgi:hypothetical protein
MNLELPWFLRRMLNLATVPDGQRGSRGRYRLGDLAIATLPGRIHDDHSGASPKRWRRRGNSA